MSASLCEFGSFSLEVNQSRLWLDDGENPVVDD